MGAAADEMPTPSPQTLRMTVSSAWSQARRYLQHASVPPNGPASALSEAAARARLPRSVRIVEVSPRDGLQNETRPVPAHVKVDLVNGLVDAGMRTIEVTAFVSPRWVPQLADAPDVLRAVRRRPDVAYSVLVPNMRGFHSAIEAGAKEIAVFAAATEQFSKRNVNCSIAESLERFRVVADAAKEKNVRVRGYVSCIAGCPYEGAVDPHQVAAVARALYDMGCYEISLGDTIGVGNPASVHNVVDAVVHAGVPVHALAIHCHDTRGTALANVLSAMLAGVSVVDASVAGLGGCPFAPGAAGNLATEDLVYMLKGMNIDCGPVDLPSLVKVGNKICAELGRPSRSKVAQAVSVPANIPSSSTDASFVAPPCGGEATLKSSDQPDSVPRRVLAQPEIEAQRPKSPPNQSPQDVDAA